MLEKLKLSIIIATYNRAHIIDHCLQSLVEQTASQDSFEVIVINNNSTDNTDKIVQNFEGKLKNLKTIHEKNQGLSHARNAGIAVAQSEWIASLDDDAKAHSNWVEVILREIERNNFDVFGGPYLSWHYYGPAPLWFASEWESTLKEFNYYGKISLQGGYPTGGNCVFYKDAVLQVNGFNANLGMIGNKCAYGEETKLFEDMRNAGFRLGSVPDLLIDHCVLPYKYSLTWRLKSAYALGQASPYTNPQLATLRHLPRRLASVAKQCVLMPYRAVRGILNKHPWQRILLECTTPLLKAIGHLHGFILINFTKTNII